MRKCWPRRMESTIWIKQGYINALSSFHLPATHLAEPNKTVHHTRPLTHNLVLTPINPATEDVPATTTRTCCYLATCCPTTRCPVCRNLRDRPLTDSLPSQLQGCLQVYCRVVPQEAERRHVVLATCPVSLLPPLQTKLPRRSRI
jgi:hypothetical protein